MFYRIGTMVVRSPFSIRRPKRGEDCLVVKTFSSFPPAHPSTKAALTIMHRLKIEKKARILDIGCGSGILGLAAALKNDGTSVGCDINPESIKASMKNAVLNRMQDRLYLFCGTVNALSESFHLVLANLPAGVHEQMFDHYPRLIHRNKGLLVVSGFYDVHAPDIEKKLARRGLIVLERVEINAWAAAYTPECSNTWAGLGLKTEK